MNKKTLIATSLLVGVMMMTGTMAFAPDSRAQAAVDEDIKLFRKDVLNKSAQWSTLVVGVAFSVTQICLTLRKSLQC
jgi:hypothetical protein